MKKVDNNESNSKEELVKRKEVENTPFTIITTNGKSFGAMGKYRITEPYDKEEEVEKELKKITWNRLIQVVILLIDSKNDIEELMNPVVKETLTKPNKK